MTNPTVTEGAAFVDFRITLPADEFEPYAIDYETADGTATAGSDYTPVSGTLFFGGGGGGFLASAGVTPQIDPDPDPDPGPIVRETQTVRVPLLSDAFREGDETFFLRLSDERLPATANPFDTGRATIRNDDVVDVTVTDGGAAAEGAPPAAGPRFVFTVSLSRALPAGDAPVVVDYSTADGTATAAGNDYVPISGALTFVPGGPTSQQVTVSARPDVVYEPDESFVLNVSSASVGTTIADGQGVATIVNDEIGVSVADAAPVNEGDPPGPGGVLLFPVTIARPLNAGEGPYSVWYTTANGTATDGPDYFGTVGKLEFTAGGPTTLNATVQVQSDLGAEANETVFLVLGEPTGLGIVRGQAVGGIVNDDTPHEIPAGVESEPVNEGGPADSVSVRFVVDAEFIDPEIIADGIFYSTADGSGPAGAVAGSDYVAGSGRVQFRLVPGAASGISVAAAPIDEGDPIDRTFQRRGTVTVRVIGDGAVEPDETFFLVLRDAGGSEIGRGEGVIVNDDADAQTVAAGAGARFDWSMTPRFGRDDNRNGRLDMPLTPEYGSATRFEVTLDGTYSRDAAGNPPVRYEWTIEAGPGVTTPRHFSGARPVLSGPDALAQGDYTVTLDVQGADGTWYSATQTVRVKDYLIVAMGDSYGSGEGNPEVDAVRDADGNLDTIDYPAEWGDGVTQDITDAHRRHHRTIYAGAAQAALALEQSDPHTSVTFLFLSQSGAEVTKGVIAPYNPDPVAEPKRVPAGWHANDPDEVTRWDRPQVQQARELIGAREIDYLALSIGGNDTGFGPILSNLLMADPVLAVLTGGIVAGFVAYQLDLARTWAQTDARLAELRDHRYPALAEALSGPGGLGVDPSHVLITEYPDPTRDETGNLAQEMMGDIQWPLEMDQNEEALALLHVFQPLTQTISDAAAANGWNFVSGISSRFSTHGYSSSDPYLRTFKEATFLQGPGPRNALELLGDPSTGTMHPNREGQLVYKDALLRRIRQMQQRPEPPAVFASVFALAPALEGNAGTNDLLFEVSLSAPTSRPVTIQYVTAGTGATAGADFTPRGGTLRFAPGTTSMTLRVPVIGDTQVEADETLTFALMNAENATIGGGQATGVILNDDNSSPITHVTRVFVNGPGLTGGAGADAVAFRAAAGIDPVYGYAVPAGAEQARSVPWVSGVNEIAVRFDTDQATWVDQGDLVVRGGDGTVRPFSAFAYDAPTRTARWTLVAPVTNDRLRLVLNGAGLLALDGEWQNASPAESFPSGDGNIGGDFDFRINVLRGDATGDGRVNALDLAYIKQRLGRTANSPGAGPGAYSVFADITGDGRVNALDLAAAKQRLGRTLPAGE